MKLKINESKTLEFEMDTSGCSWKELKGFFRLTLEGVEYGFPTVIDEGIVKVEIPIFKDVLHESIRTSLYEHKEVTVKARLDLIANNEVYISPWQGEVDIEIPVSVKITEERAIKKTDKKKITVIDPDIKEYLDEEKKEKKENKKSKFMDTFSNLKLDEEKKEKKVEEREEDKEIKDKEARKVKSKFSKMLG